MYWGIGFIDQELVFPAALRPHFPAWLDFVLHTSISIFPIFEIMLSRHSYSHRSTCIKLLLVGLISYSVWVHVVYFKTGFWVYEIFERLDDVQRALFNAFGGAVAILLYFFGEFLNFMLVGSSQKSKPQKKSKKSK